MMNTISISSAVFSMLCLMVGADEETLFSTSHRDLGATRRTYRNLRLLTTNKPLTPGRWRDRSICARHRRDGWPERSRSSTRPAPARSGTRLACISERKRPCGNRWPKNWTLFYELSDPVTFPRCGTCGEENAFWDPHIQRGHPVPRASGRVCSPLYGYCLSVTHEVSLLPVGARRHCTEVSL